MLLDAHMTWMVIGLVSGLVGVLLARRFLAPSRGTTRSVPMPPPASRQERRRRERDSAER